MMPGGRQRPVVILTGWLGCHPRNLRRYSELYDKLGWNSVARIPSPNSVVAATTEGPPDVTQAQTGKNTAFTSLRESRKMSEIEKLALDTLEHLQILKCPYFMVHNFSNGGCFLWEWIKFILRQKPAASPLYPTIDSENLQKNLVGVVFDSSPCHYDAEVHTLLTALNYVSSKSMREKLIVKATSLNRQSVENRFHEYWNGLLTDAQDTPQLYLYSPTDHLSPCRELEKLIELRKGLFGERTISKHKFPDSEHCCHLLKYPEQYTNVIKKFIDESVGEYRHGSNPLETLPITKSRL